MVAKIRSGRNIRGALSYNENKVEVNKAKLIGANGYSKDFSDLSFQYKFHRLQHQADLNERIQHRCVHISLNFDPSEKFEEEKLNTIAAEYMELIGFGNQPYLVYEHFDAAHPHIHIVTTSIEQDGSPIKLHRLDKKSEPARKHLEKKHGLIKAEGRKKEQDFLPKPIDLSVVEYGKSETKAKISSIVRSVVEKYKFSSLAQLNAVLGQFNVIADPGAKGTRMNEKGGLQYWICERGIKMGLPIKASRIYSKPTLANLEPKFTENEIKKDSYQERVRRLVDNAMEDCIGKLQLIDKLKKKGIGVIFRENAEGKVYGVTYIDNRTFCVFNGSDLDKRNKRYSAAAILERLSNPEAGNEAEVKSNWDFVSMVLDQTKFDVTYKDVVRGWITKGLLVEGRRAATNETLYFAGDFRTGLYSFVPLPKKIATYLRVNGYTLKTSQRIIENVKEMLNRYPRVDPFEVISSNITNLIDAAFHTTEDQYVDYHWLRSGLDRKRKKKPKW